MELFNSKDWNFQQSIMYIIVIELTKLWNTSKVSLFVDPIAAGQYFIWIIPRGSSPAPAYDSPFVGQPFPAPLWKSTASLSKTPVLASFAKEAFWCLPDADSDNDEKATTNISSL